MNEAELRELRANKGARLPIRRSSADELDGGRLSEYFHGILGEEDRADWSSMLHLRDLLVTVESDAAPCCSYAAYVLFALEPSRPTALR